MKNATSPTRDDIQTRFDVDGAVSASGAALEILEPLRAGLSGIPLGPSGARLFGVATLGNSRRIIGPLTKLARQYLGDAARPVRALLFDKTAKSNWSLAWHQDRVIAVRRRMETSGFTNWTVKDGVPHVSPPIDLLERMITLRVDLDPVTADNSPLLIAPGSHRVGLIREDQIDAVVRGCGVRPCLADAGDVWVYSTPILHASQVSRSSERRRVLQIDYAAFDLPGGLEWHGLH